jgi:hypothetical protein
MGKGRQGGWPSGLRRQVGVLFHHMIERALTLIDLSSAFRKETRVRTSFLSITSPFLAFFLTPQYQAVTQA